MVDKTIKGIGRKKNTIDLNSILQGANLLIFIFTCYSYFLNGKNHFVNLNTIIWGSVLFAQVGVFLYIEKLRRDPFVILLCFQMVFFYLFRILTLSIYPFSFVFDRFEFSPANLNEAIAFIIVANFALYLSFYLNKAKPANAGPLKEVSPRKPYLLLGVLFFVYVMTYSSALSGAVELVVGFINNLFINVAVVIFMIIIYLMLFNHKLSFLNKILLISGLLIYVVIATLSGSRSAVITISYFLLFATLAISGAVRIKRVYLVIGVFFVPLMVVFFTVATFLRPRLENRADVNGDTFSVLKEFDLKQTITDGGEIILSPIFGRIGFLDFCAEVMANQDKYQEVFSFSFYAKSLVDNVLTPGFDVFDTPKTSNAISFVYYKQGTPKKSKVSDIYQSDEFTIYGEAYALFGKWFAIIPIFFMGFAFKRLYVKINDINIFSYYVKRSFVLYVFLTFLNSFGLDWLLFDIIGIMFTYLIFKSFFKFTKPHSVVLTSDL